MVDGVDMDDGTASVSPSALNLALEQEEEMEFLGEPKSEMQHGIAQQHQHTMSEKMLFGNGSGLKKRDGKAGDKHQEKEK